MTRSRNASGKRKRPRNLSAPTFMGWSTSDEDEVERRIWRGLTEAFEIEALDTGFPHFGNFLVRSASDNEYHVEIRDVSARNNSCSCQDFWNNRLGTCKHIEAVRRRLLGPKRKSLPRDIGQKSQRTELYLDMFGDGRPTVSQTGANEISGRIDRHVRDLRENASREALQAIRDVARENPHRLRVSRLIDRWVEESNRLNERFRRRERFLSDVEAGQQSLDVLKFPLYPYQRDGMLHLAFGERALLADEMGLGKTVQALAACVLLHRSGSANRALVVCPASLKAEWKEQIEAATDHDHRIISGSRAQRTAQYRDPPLFTIMNYEQILSDLDLVQDVLSPDIIILDEAQRIKNWRTKTASAVKRLRSRFAFVLTGTPIENRIDDLYSIVQFLEPGLLGPLFRFNRDHYELDDKGRPVGVRNLDSLTEKIRPIMLRRRKAEIETDLPGRSFNNFFLEMTEEQRLRYIDEERIVARYARLADRRVLTPEEFKLLQAALARMRMTCDTPYILDPKVRDCPKLEELERVLEELLEDPERKILVFSEWVRMLELVRERLDDLEVDFALHTGSVPQDRRRAEIARFKQDPGCRLFLSSESGGTGLNLQVANAVINLDLPWNPAKLEQRIARAWRKHQKRSVSVLNFVTRDSIEHRMLGLLETKQALADTVLDERTGEKPVRFQSGRAAFIEKVQRVLKPTADEVHVDPAVEFTDRVKEEFGPELLRIECLRTQDGRESLLVVVDGAVDPERLAASAGGELEFQCVSRESYETLRRMEAAGQIVFSSKSERVLYRNETSRQDILARRRREAQELLAKADHLHKMTRLLAGGGFLPEAEAKVGEIAGFCLRSLAALALPEEESNATPMVLCQRLGECGVIPEHLKVRTMTVCEISPGEPSDSEAEGDHLSVLDRVDQLMNHVRGHVGNH